MTSLSGPPGPAQDAFLTALAAVEEIALFAGSRQDETLSRFLQEVAGALRAASAATPPRPGNLGGPNPD